MADIIDFRRRATQARDTATTSNPAFDSETAFDVSTLNEGALDSTLLNAGSTAACDWTNQELADIYRAERLLAASGAGCEVDRGVTDEGDPWVVFCLSCGEVFAHLARIDGVYVLDGAVLEAPIYGRDFAALVDSFGGIVSPRPAMVRPGDRRVVPFGRDRKVFLHPAAQLAALIWTVYLAADEVELPPLEVARLAEGMTRVADLPDGVEDILLAGLADPENETELAAPAAAIDPLTGLPVSPEEEDRAVLLSAGMGAMTLALTSLAGGLGLLNLRALEVDADGRPEANEDGAEDGATGIAAHAAHDILPGASAPVQADHSSDADRADGTAADDPDLATAELEPTSLGRWQDLPTPATLPLENASAPARRVEIPDEERQDEMVQAAPISPEEPEAEAGQSSKDTTAVASIGHPVHNIVLSDLALTSYAIDDRVVFSTLDWDAVRDLIGDGLGSSLVEAATDEMLMSPPNLARYSEQVEDFVGFLLGQKAEVIVYNTEVLVVEADAQSGELYARSWLTESGDIVSTVGLRSTFEAYDLIA